MKILIVYGTTEGHTATLVELMRESIAGRGLDVQVGGPVISRQG